jgi:predicted RNase H-like HicB family nuclease
MKVIVVRAEWDPEAQVWVAESADLEGLVTEAETMEGLRARLALVIPDLLNEYGETDPDLSIELIAHSHDRLQLNRQAA